MKNLLSLLIFIFIVGCAPLQMRVTSDIPGVAGPVASFAAKNLPIDGCPPGTIARSMGNSYSYVYQNNYQYQYFRYAPVVSEVHDFVVMCSPQNNAFRP